jgi:hypothetical protein
MDGSSEWITGDRPVEVGLVLDSRYPVDVQSAVQELNLPKAN